MKYPSNSGELVEKIDSQMLRARGGRAVIFQGIGDLHGLGHVPYFLKVHFVILKGEWLVGSSRTLDQSS